MVHKNKVLYYIVYIILALGIILMLFPFVWMFLSGFKTNADAMALPPRLFSGNMTLDNYKKLFVEMNFGIYFINTIIIVLLSFGGLIINGFAGYGFAKYDFPHKEKIFLLFLATMMIPSQITMLPNFIILFNMGLMNTFIGMVLPGLASGFSVFLFRQFFEIIPDEVLESGRMEGMSEMKIFWKIILPMSKPVFAIQALLVSIGGWNSFIWPLLLATTPDKFTLSIGLSLLKGQYIWDIALQMAGATFVVIPLIIVFIIFQRKIIEGLNFTGSK